MLHKSHRFPHFSCGFSLPFCRAMYYNIDRMCPPRGRRRKYRFPMTPKTKILALLAHYGGDILSAAAMRTQENYTQHGTTSVYLHCVNVAYISVQLALFLRLHVNYRALVRGALRARLHPCAHGAAQCRARLHAGRGGARCDCAAHVPAQSHAAALPRERARLPCRQILRRHRDAASAHPRRGCPAVLPQISDPSNRSPKRRMRK